jgi:hypothetical protein
MSVDYAGQLTATEVLIKELKQQFNDGEIGDEDFATKLEELGDKRGELKTSAKLAADYAVKAQAHQAEQKVVDDANWKTAVLGFKTTHAHLFGPDHFDKFNVFVGRVTAPGSQYAHLPFDKQLAKAALDYAFEADKPDLAKATGKAGKAPAPAPQPGKKQAKPGAFAAPKQTKTPVPTLARVPATKGTSVDGSRFGALDDAMMSGDPDRAEALLSRMTAEQREQYGMSY